MSYRTYRVFHLQIVRFNALNSKNILLMRPAQRTKMDYKPSLSPLERRSRIPIGNDNGICYIYLINLQPTMSILTLLPPLLFKLFRASSPQ